MADVVTIADEDDVPLVCVHAREVLTALGEGSRCSSFAA
jgi:hypothetical protein